MMKKDFFKAAAGMAAAMLLLTGCGSKMPDLTKEQEKAVGEYAAMLLLKYDADNGSRLVDLSAEEEKNSGTGAENSVAAPGNTDSLPVIEDTDAAGETTDAQTSAGKGENAIASIEEFFELPAGIKIIYQGAQTCASYPEEGEEEYFALDASAGKSLLVLSFAVENQTENNADIDLLRQDARYGITVNGSATRNALLTMLENDMTTYKGTIPAGERADVVLIAEMEQDTLNEISTISLKMKNDATTYTIQLQ